MSGIFITKTRKIDGSHPYYQFGHEPLRFPSQWRSGPGGQLQSRVGGETRELSGLSGCPAAYCTSNSTAGLGSLGGGDTIESGLNPYTIEYPPLAHRGLGFFDDLSANEQKLAKLAIAGGLLYIVLRRAGVLGKRTNPARAKRRRGRTRSSYRARRRRWKRR